jgi:hypothetical protein
MSPRSGKNNSIDRPLPTFTCTQKHIDRLPPSLKPFVVELVANGQIIIKPDVQP